MPAWWKPPGEPAARLADSSFASKTNRGHFPRKINDISSRFNSTCPSCSCRCCCRCRKVSCCRAELNTSCAIKWPLELDRRHKRRDNSATDNPFAAPRDRPARRFAHYSCPARCASLGFAFLAGDLDDNAKHANQLAGSEFEFCQFSHRRRGATIIFPLRFCVSFACLLSLTRRQTRRKWSLLRAGRSN